MAGKIGVLALQGDVSLHQGKLETLGETAVAVRNPKELRSLKGLVIPGGESTALLRLCEPLNMLEAISDFARGGGSVFGTCAGAILLSKEVLNPAQRSLGLIDLTIRRNGYGRQLDSMETTGQRHGALATDKKNLPMVFIRAPRITRTGPDVELLASFRGEPVLVRQGSVMAATFHPELTADDTVYKYWLLHV